MKKLTFACALLLGACSSGNTTDDHQARYETAAEAIRVLERGDATAFEACTAVAEACGEAAAGEWCDVGSEDCGAFGDFLHESRGGATDCWQGCMTPDGCDVEECRGLSRAHEDGRAPGMACLDEMGECVALGLDEECCLDPCGGSSFGVGFGHGPSKRGGEWSSQGARPDAGWPQEGTAWESPEDVGDGFGGEAPEGTSWPTDGERPEGGFADAGAFSPRR
jgi:hypothetical protein